ncbi:MAG TPA: MFS transporter, partial [Gaiellaceae bacterium]|nr:MFS transporter [Gaiellaceae bacterium]
MNVIRLAVALFLIQAGFHGYTASLPLALAQADVPDAQIGLIVGVAALVQMPAAIVGGRLVDAFGGIRLLLAGACAYLLASGILLLPGVEAGGPALPFVAARALQGVGIAASLPAALSLVPRMLPKGRHGSGLAFVGAAHNLTLVLLPPISIYVLDTYSFDAVSVVVIAFVVVGMALTWRLPIRPRVREATAVVGAASRRFGITFRRAWAVPLAIVVTYVAHWGAVTAYLPVRASEAGADIGLYFAADGLAIFLMRLPTGWLTDRISTRTLVVTGATATAFAVGLLLLPLTTPLLVVSGLIGGAGGAIVMTPLLVE